MCTRLYARRSCVGINTLAFFTGEIGRSAPFTFTEILPRPFVQDHLVVAQIFKRAVTVFGPNDPEKLVGDSVSME